MTLSATLLGRKAWAEPLEDISALKTAPSPSAAPDITFLSADGSEHHLSEFEGRGVVLNFWATWCAPCVAEMPGLGKLASAVASQNIAVLPLSADRGGVLVVQQFYEQHGVQSLPILLDPKGAAARAFGVSGLPTTIIIDKKGQEHARLTGGADWSTEAASRKVRELAG
ncbi:MAG: TlpA family protein disulfide reductase [Acetobacteraceae bacterium]|nr:TlpA family protein disulfide reductase [Acetobacteraceae bacterium]MBV8526558.1 TlpA family protein disulfide reductase [Acetobacteraceae bacterium]